MAELRTATAGRLRARREEIEAAVIHRALSVGPLSGMEAPGYAEGLREVIPMVVAHAFEAIELGEERLGPTPPAVYGQAVASARSEVGLEVVLRRYASGYSTLSDFLHQEVRALAGSHYSGYPILHRELTALFERLIAEVGEAYRREAAAAAASPQTHRLTRIRGLLAGELLDTSALDYEFAVWHLGLIVRHPGGGELVRSLLEKLDRRALLVEVDEECSWAWLGGRSPFEHEELELIAGHEWPEEALVASGVPAHDVAGWRLTHRQASSALSVALRRGGPFTAYGEVGLAAAILRDKDLVTYLKDAFLVPLAGARGGGETLRAYFDSGENVSSTAAALGVSRQTVASRLRIVEEMINRPITTCRGEIEAALTIEALAPARLG